MTKSRIAAVLFAALFSTAAFAETAAERPVTPDDVARGKYLVTIMSCTDCHTPGHFFGKPDMTKYLAGSDVGFAVPGLGYFYGPNLTPDDETGLGKWSMAEIVTSMRTGVRPDGRVLAPVMPWMAFANLTDDDAFAIAAYLKSMPPLSHKAPPPTGWGETPPGPFQQVTMPPAP
jgi:mono/diheme cytochrome c family protein